ncbi:LIM domain-containing protein PLIM2c [Capsicum baccatum]|uniref:LIM domain-containing protein PLIM2c n=1 Tax=Capsicum baccatum TaxID=33114 RepID=A0A2G2W5R3_CAPBA|nr:LIM domain-containing protein PLIM2c [Capsicum baccatum]
MAFTGTLDKCTACDKTVYFIDLLSADGVTYHRTCFKCSHCKGTLVMSNYSSMDGVLYCKTHFEQLFKQSGNFSKNFQNSKTTERQNSLTRAPSKLSAMFSGTQDKCAACDKTVYPLEKVTMEGESFHKSCFKCAHGGCPLTHATYASLDGNLYCKHHFAQLFMEKGNYQHVLKAANNKKNSAAVTPLNDDDTTEDKNNAAVAVAVDNTSTEQENKESENTEESQELS